jgi:Ca2+-binding RTX toxin-like protein
VRIPRITVAAVLVVAVAFSVTTADTAANVTPTSKVEDDSRPITPDAMKPVECAAIALNAQLSGSGAINGAGTDELITGSAVADNIKGNGGDDCILGGDGNDTIAGGKGIDVCIGGGGTDTFNNDCETKIQ